MTAPVATKRAPESGSSIGPDPAPSPDKATGVRGALVRISAFVRKELVGVGRQPALVMTLVLGPFLILLLFGAGLSDQAPPVRAVFVAPEGSDVAAQAREFAQTEDTRLDVQDVTNDVEDSLRRLDAGELDLVVEFPSNIDEALEEGRRPAIVFYHAYLDPIEAQAMIASMRTAIDEINQQIARSLVAQAQTDVESVQDRVAAAGDRIAAVRAAVAEGNEEEARRQLALLRGQVAGLESGLDVDPGAADVEEPPAQDSAPGTVGELAEEVDELAELAEREGVPTPALTALDALAADLASLQAGLEEFGSLPPGLFVSPFRGVAERVIEATELTDFYAPAVLVLLAQHLAITFIGLSVVRDEELGTTELFRVAPLNPGEVLTGTCLAHLLLSGAVTAVLTGLLVIGLGVPMRGSWWLLALSVTVLLAASTGLGFLIALLADSATKAVQYAMMLLLANVFFSGFLVSLDRFQDAAAVVPWLLPAAYGVQLLRGVMLRGDAPDTLLLATLAAMAVVVLTLSWLLLRRRLLRT